MYLLAKLHPHLTETEKKDYTGPWLSRKAKEEIVDRFYRDKRRVPLCIDHKASTLGYVKPADSIGQVCDLFIDKDNELILKCKLSKEHKAGFEEVNTGMFAKKERWGVSVGLNRVPDGRGGVKERNLVHVALTTKPGFGKYETFISHWGFNDERMNRLIVEKYGGPDGSTFNQLYLMGTLKDKLEGYRPRRMQEQDASMDPTTTTANNNMESEIKQEVKNESGQDSAVAELEKMRVALSDMEEFAQKNPRIFMDDPKFAKDFHELKGGIVSSVEKHNKHVQMLCDTKKLSKARRDAVFDLLGASATECNELQNIMVDFVGANEKAFAEAEQRYQAAEEENIALKRKIEEETLNLNQKRPRNQYNSPGGNTTPIYTPKVSWTPTQLQKTAPQEQKSKSLNEQYNLIQTGKVHYAEPLGNESINKAITQRANPYEQSRSYQTSASIYGFAQKLDLMSNQAMDSKSGQSGSLSRPVFT